MKQTFIFRGSELGSREVEETWASDPLGHAAGARFRHTNVSFFCPRCGDIWAQVWYERAMPNCRVETRNCPECPDIGLANAGWTDWKRGSFQAPFPELVDPLNFAEDWPEEVIRHEFNLLMEKLKGEDR